MQSKKKSFAKGKLLYYLLIGVFAVVFLICAVELGTYWVESAKAGNQYDDLASLKGNHTTTESSQPEPSDPDASDSTSPSDNPVESTPATPTEPSILPELLPIYELNADTVGWITVPDTKIDYPVMQTPDRPDYYLKRNFNRTWSDWGAIYAEEACDISLPSDNITLYGHHMKDGSMFAGLDKYKKQAFWETHQTFSFDTLYERHTYQIWAVFKTSGNAGEGFPYHTFSDAASEEEFNDFVETVKSMEFYPTGITPQYGDKLLTLSTCEYSLNNGRFVVCAVRIS